MEDPIVDNFRCQCEDEFRSACEGLPFYAEHGGKRYCVLHSPNKEKVAEGGKLLEAMKAKMEDQDFDFSGLYVPSSPPAFLDFSTYEFEERVSFKGATFNTPVYFSGGTFHKQATFAGATFCEKVSFADATFNSTAFFQGATFREARFSEAKFNGSADFSTTTFREEAHFPGARFSERASFDKSIVGAEAHFANAVFHKNAFFRGTTFEKNANFAGTTFDRNGDFAWAAFHAEAGFSGAKFGETAYFVSAGFSDRTSFSGATFGGRADFSAATFSGRTWFYDLKTCRHTQLKFAAADVERPELFAFHTAHLRPSWFIDLDPQKFDFSDVEWFELPEGNQLSIEDEIEVLRGRGVDRCRSLRKLAKACRRLMANAEDNRDYSAANEFHYWSMEAQRKDGWSGSRFIVTLYWALSGYGEKPRRAFGVLFGVWVVFAACYASVPSAPFWAFPVSGVWEGLASVGQVLLFSLSVLFRLNPRLSSEELSWFEALVIVEGVLGPLQIALLVLAVRRQVMR